MSPEEAAREMEHLPVPLEKVDEGFEILMGGSFIPGLTQKIRSELRNALHNNYTLRRVLDALAHDTQLTYLFEALAVRDHNLEHTQHDFARECIELVYAELCAQHPDLPRINYNDPKFTDFFCDILLEFQGWGSM